MTITAKRLEELGACQRQIAAFRKLWGDGPAPMTVEAAVEHAEAFVWEQFARMFLKAPARDEYRRATGPARAEYERARTAAWAEAAWAEAAEFERATAPAWADLKRACARAFAEAYIKQETAKPPSRRSSRPR
jgi:hypothetical protein